MPNIVVDTNVFIRLRGVYEEAYQCLTRSTDVICASKQIVNEYEGRATASKLFHVKIFIEALKRDKKLAIKKQSYVEQRVKRLENARIINYPTHEKDRKFVKVAIATKSRYIVSNDPDLLGLPPNRCNKEYTENISPHQYIEVNS